MLVALLVLGGVLCLLWWETIRMPGRSHRGALPPPTPEELAIAATLRRDVETLAGEIGERNDISYANLLRAEEYLRGRFAELGYAPTAQEYALGGRTFRNIIVEVPGTRSPGEVIVVGGHYDTVPGTPGANDNASGVAATLVLAESFRALRPGRTVRFAAFVNEEPPFFQTPGMGSYVYAAECRRRRENIVGMISIETIGYYSDAPGSQHLLPPFNLLKPTTGNYIGFVGNFGSHRLVRQLITEFRRTTPFPSDGVTVPAIFPGVGWSDHWSFWQHGYPGMMVTDTAPFRYPHYHRFNDTPDKIDYDRTARVVAGLGRTLEALAR